MILVSVVLAGTTILAQPAAPPLSTKGETFDDLDDLLGSVSRTSADHSISWNGDGSVLATSSGDTVHLWDVATGREIRRFRDREGFGGVSPKVRSVAFNPRRAKLAAASEDGIVRIWDLNKPTEPKRFPGWSVAWSDDGRLLATGSRGGTIHVWDIETEVEAYPARPAHAHWVSSLAWSGDRLASGSLDGTIRIVDGQDGSTIRLLEGHEEQVNGIAWSPDGALLASVSSDGTLRVWTVETGTGIRVEVHGSPVNAVDWSADGYTVATGSEDRSIRLWNLGSGNELREVGLFPGHGSAVNAVAFSPGGKLLASGSANGMVRIWAVASSREIVQLRGRAARVSALALGRGGRTLAVGVENESLLVWSLGEGGEARIPAPSRLSLEDTSALRSVAVSADGAVVAVGFLDGTVAVWVAGSIRYSQRHHVYAVSSLALSPQAVRLASASQERVVIWDLTDRTFRSDFDPHLGTPSALAWSGDGKLAIGTRAGRVGIWSDEEMKPIREGFQEILSLAFPAGDEVLVLQRDRTLHRWNLATGEVRQDGALAERLSNVALSPDGEFLTAVRIGERIVRLGRRRGESYPWSHRFLGGAAPDHLWIGCVGQRCWRYDDGTLLLREAPSGELSAVLPPGPEPTPQVEITVDAQLEVTAGAAAPLTVEVTNHGESPIFWIALRQAVDADSPLIFHPPPVIIVLEPGETTRLRCRVSFHLAHDDPREETFSLHLEASSAGGPLSAPDPIAVTVRTPSLRWDDVHLSGGSLAVAITNVGQRSLPPTRLVAEFPERDVTSELKILDAIAAGESRAVSLALSEKIGRGTAQLAVETAQHPVYRWTSEKQLGLGAWLWRLVGLLIGVTLLFLFLWLRNRKRRLDRPGGGTLTAGPDLQAFSDLLQTSVDRDEAYRIVEIHMARQIFPEFDGALLVLADDNQLRVPCRWEGGSSDPREMFEREDCLALRQAKTAVADRDARLVCRHVDPPHRSYVCVPLQARGRTHGVLHLMSRNPELVTLPPATLETAQAAAREIARTLARLRELEQTWHDELTGLLDRRIWNDQLEQHVKHLLEGDIRFGVMMMDIDHFGEFNKQHGYPAGDEILREIGKLLLSLTREQDVVCRYGGEEFLILMPNASLETTRERAEQLRREVQHRRPQGPEGQSLGPVTLSFGVASFPEHGGSWNVVLAAADSALRRAKNEGRNRVAVASTDEGPTQ